jgi:hypothetical protein
MMKEGSGAPKKLCTHKFVHTHVDLQKVLEHKKSYAHVSLCTPTSTCTLCSSLFLHGDGTASVQREIPANENVTLRASLPGD